MAAWPRTIVPVSNTDFEVPGPLITRAQSGKVNLRATTQRGRTWTESYMLKVSKEDSKEFLAYVRATWRAGTSFDIVHRDYLTPNGTEGGTPAIDLPTTGAVSFTYVDGGAGADTITRASGSFLTDGLWVGMRIRVSGTTNNDGDYTIVDVVALTITLATGVLTAEGPVSSTIAAVSTGSYINIDGASNSITGWLKAGDIISIAGINCVYDVTADVNTNAGGQAAIPISPPIFTGGSPADGALVTTTGVAVKAIIAEPPDWPETSGDSADWGILAIRFLETLEAAS